MLLSASTAKAEDSEAAPAAGAGVRADVKFADNAGGSKGAGVRAGPGVGGAARRWSWSQSRQGLNR